ncbi:MAG TPA: superoxide dismutase family protein [Chthoniobacterales bacterium]
MKTHLRLLLVSAVAVCSAASIARAAENDDVQKAIAVLAPTQGSKVMGTVTFTKSSDGVRVVADLTGLTPGKHGFHIHEFGDCSDPKAESAGGHFNPTKHSHAGPEASERHAGDMGNIDADASGKARVDVTLKNVSMDDDDNSIIGHAVIVHEKEDDLKTQPTGNAGGRLACGVIGVAKP